MAEWWPWRLGGESWSGLDVDWWTVTGVVSGGLGGVGERVRVESGFDYESSKQRSTKAKGGFCAPP